MNHNELAGRINKDRLATIVNSVKYDGPGAFDLFQMMRCLAPDSCPHSEDSKLYHFYLYPLSTVVDTIENGGRNCIKQASYDKSPQVPALAKFL
jgi:hypothetical protein